MNDQFPTLTNPDEADSAEVVIARLGLGPADRVILIGRAGPRRVFRALVGQIPMVVKHFVDPTGRNEIGAYALLQSLGIATPHVYAAGDDAIAMEDLAASGRWRLGCEGDCTDAAVGRALARWYGQLHTAGRKLLSSGSARPSFLRREDENLSHESILRMGKKLRLAHLPVWKLCAERIDILKHAIGLEDRTLTYNDFHWSNMAVSKAPGAVTEGVVFDYHLLGIGMACSDVRNVLSVLSGPGADAFRDAYDPVQRRQELLDAPVSVLVALGEAVGRAELPRWSHGLVAMAVDGRLETSLWKAMETANEK